MDDTLLQQLRTHLDTMTQAGGPAQRTELLAAMQFLDAHRDNAALPPRLRHFLQGRSYHKARQFLNGEAPAAGACSLQP